MFLHQETPLRGLGTIVNLLILFGPPAQLTVRFPVGVLCKPQLAMYIELLKGRTRVSFNLISNLLVRDTCVKVSLYLCFDQAPDRDVSRVYIMFIVE